MRNERGMAMVIALVVAVLLSLLCLSLTFSSMNEFQISTEFENHEKALLVADAGFNAEKQGLRGDVLNTLLAKKTTIYVRTPDPAIAKWAMRNPISPVDARNVDFFSATSGGTAVQIAGLLTPANGTPITRTYTGTDGKLKTENVPGALYFARLMDNDDGDGNTAADVDNTVFLRVIGIQRGTTAETASRRNSVAIIEAQLHRDMSFDMTGPLSLISKQVTANFDGNSFRVDGYDHTGMTIADLNKGHSDATLNPFTAISCLFDNPGLGDATAAVNNVKNALDTNQYNNVIGAGTPPSISDDTIEIKTSTNPDSSNVLNAAYLNMVATRVGAVADNKYPVGTDTSTKFKGGDVFGTPADPKITYVKGDLEIQGNCSGAGLLVVTGNMGGNGAFEFEGLVLVLGKGELSMGGANKTILGGIVVAKIEPGSPPTFGTANIDIRGRSEFYFAGDKIRLAAALFPMKTISWREITPEVEPMAVSSY